MNELLVGYARVSTEQQDLTAQPIGLKALGVTMIVSTSIMD
jgi:DNA invertase Pin-like site-specific DNA recombinase